MRTQQRYKVAYYGEAFEISQEEMLGFEKALVAGKSIVRVGDRILTDKFLYITPIFKKRYLELVDKTDKTDAEIRELDAIEYDSTFGPSR